MGDSLTLASQLALQSTLKEAMRDPWFFAVEANRNYMKAQPEQGKPLGEFHRQLCRIYETPVPKDDIAKAVIWAPRKHLKTTLGLSRFLYLTAKYPKLRLRYTMADRDLAREKSQQLVDIVDANPWMPHEWSDRANWSGDQRRFSNGSLINFGG